MWVELIDILASPHFFHKDVGDGRADAEGLEAGVLVGGDFLGVQQVGKVGVHHAEVHRPCTRPLSRLVGVTQHVVEHLGDAHNALRHVLNAAQRLAPRPQVAGLHADATAALAEFGHEGQRLGNRIQVVGAVLEQKARHQAAGIRLARVHQRRGGGRKRLVDEVVNEFQRLLHVLRAGERGDAEAVLVAFQPARTVRRHRGVLGIELVRAHERLEAELVAVGAFKDGADFLGGITLEQMGVPDSVFGQVTNLLVQVVEKDGVRVDFLLKIGLQGIRVVAGVHHVSGEDFVVQFDPAFHRGSPIRAVIPAGAACSRSQRVTRSRSAAVPPLFNLATTGTPYSAAIRSAARAKLCPQ